MIPDDSGGRDDDEQRAGSRAPDGSEDLLSSRMFRVALEQAYDAVMITSPDLQAPGPTILYVNAAFTEMTGYSAPEAIGRSPRFLQGPKTSRRTLARLRRDLEQGRSFNGCTINYRKDGSEFWLEWRVAPVFDDGGRIAHYVSLQHDVSLAMELRAQRERAHAELERLVATRTQALQQTLEDNRRILARERQAREQAETAQRQLRAQSRTKDEFLAMLAHELRNPLSSISTATQLMKLGPSSLPESAVRACGVIERQTHHLVRLVDDLLDQARLARGELELRKQPVALDTIVAEAIEATRTQIEAHQHTLHVSLPESAVTLFGDPTRLVQALSNLLSNATRYTPSGGTISVRATCEDDAVLIHVQDTGIGVEPEMRDKVFDMFARANGEGLRMEGGLGLGLSLTRRLVELHGGWVWLARSERGLGSDFVIRLPVLQEPQQAVTGADEGGPISRNGGMRILVVEDHDDVRETLAMLLVAQGHQVQTAEDGRLGLERAGRFRPDVVLLDIGLPGLDGYAVARELRARGEQARLVALTGYGTQRDRARAQDSGFDALLVKPVSPEDLAEEIARAERTEDGRGDAGFDLGSQPAGH